MNEVYYYGQNSCYDSTSIGFDQSQPPRSPVIHQPPQELSIQEMEDLKQQYLDELQRLSNLEYRDEIKIAELKENFNGMGIKIRKKEKLLQEEHMRDEHLDTIPATESDEFIKSSVENLIPIPSESEGIPKHVCDVPSHDNCPPLDVSKDQFEDLSESNEEFSSTDDDSFSFDKIDYVEASPPDFELVSSEVMEIVIPKVGGIKASNDNPIPFYDPVISGTPPNLIPSRESDFFLEGDMCLFEAFLNDDHSFDFKTKSSSTSLNSLLEETNNIDNSLPKFTTFSNVLFDADYKSDSSDDQTSFDEDVLEKIVLKPLSEEEIIPMESLRTHDSSLPISSKIDSLLDEFAGFYHWKSQFRMLQCVEQWMKWVCLPEEEKTDGENTTHTTAKEPPSHTEGETDADIQKSLKNQKQSTDANIEFIDSSTHPPSITQVWDQRKLVKASSIVRPDLDKPEEIKKAEEEARLNAISKTKVIKVVREEANKLGIHPKRQSPPKLVNCLRKLKMLNMSRLKPKPIIDIKIHPKTKPVVITVYEGTDGRNFDVHKPFLFGEFGISELDELREIIPKKKNGVVKDLMNSLSQRKWKHMELEPETRIPGLECNRALLKNVTFKNNLVNEEPKYQIFFTDEFGDQAFQRWSDIDKVGMEALVSYLVAASMVISPENERFSMKLRKLIAEHPDQEKLK
nr:hypothetical protein [Tanacetum cinerariifolium]